MGPQSIHASSAYVPDLQSCEWSGQLRMDIHPQLESDLFILRGDVILLGNGTIPYLMLNATLHQGKAPMLSTKYLLLKLESNRDYSFEIAKNIKLLPGEYICTLEASGPSGTLASERRRCSLEREQVDLISSEISSGILLSPSEARALYAGRPLYGYQSIENEGQKESLSGEAGDEREEREGVSKEDEIEGGQENAKGMQSVKSEGYRIDENESDDSVPEDGSAPGDSNEGTEAEDLSPFLPEVNADNYKSEPDGGEAPAGGGGEDGEDEEDSDEADVGSDGGYSESPASLLTPLKEPEAGFVGSSTSKKYHLPDCRYAQKIKPENRVSFQSAEEAERQGYTPCKSCHP